MSELTKERLEEWYSPRTKMEITPEEDAELTLDKRREEAEDRDRGFNSEAVEEF